MFPIIMVGGGKGGTGKSMVSISLIDYYLQTEQDCFLIETDTSNPDVFKCYGDTIPSIMLDLDKPRGWTDLGDLCGENADKVIIINGAARSNIATTKYANNLAIAAEGLERSLITFWVINSQRDSIELLKEYFDAVQGGVIHVVRNGMFGDEDDFTTYNNSSIRKTIEKTGKSLMLDILADRVSERLYNERKTIEEAIAEMPWGSKAELMRWRNKCKQMFDEVLTHE
jgi:hypothetical protein